MSDTPHLLYEIDVVTLSNLYAVRKIFSVSRIGDAADPIANSIASCEYLGSGLIGDQYEKTEPPLCGSNIVMIGKHSRGSWVAQERSGLYGGLFINRAAAVKFALFENGNHPEAIIDAPSILELSLNGPFSSDRMPTSSDNILQRRAA